MLKEDHFLVVPVSMTLSSIHEVIAKEFNEAYQFPIHWTDELNACNSLVVAKSLLDNLLKNGNKYRIVKYTETIEEIV